MYIGICNLSQSKRQISFPPYLGGRCDHLPIEDLCVIYCSVTLFFAWISRRGCMQPGLHTSYRPQNTFRSNHRKFRSVSGQFSSSKMVLFGHQNPPVPNPGPCTSHTLSWEGYFNQDHHVWQGVQRKVRVCETFNFEFTRQHHRSILQTLQLFSQRVKLLIAPTITPCTQSLVLPLCCMLL